MQTVINTINGRDQHYKINGRKIKQWRTHEIV